MYNTNNLSDNTLNAEFPLQILGAPNNLYTKKDKYFIPITCLALLNNGSITYCISDSDNKIKPVENMEVYKFNRFTRKYSKQ